MRNITTSLIENQNVPNNLVDILCSLCTIKFQHLKFLLYQLMVCKRHIVRAGILHNIYSHARIYRVCAAAAAGTVTGGTICL
jgi:hypothetical protein